jgi:hypothetical protein
MHANHGGGAAAGFSFVNMVLEMLIAAGFAGVFALVAARALAGRNLVPVHDPYLHETLPAFTHEEVLMGGAYDKTL